MRQLLLPFALGLSLLGCAFGPLNPRQEVSIDINQEGTIGARAYAYGESVELGGLEPEPHQGDCIGCFEWADRDDLGATFTSLTCEPAEACGDIQLEGATASWTPLATSYSVSVVVDGEGIHRTKTVAVSANRAPPRRGRSREERSREAELEAPPHRR